MHKEELENFIIQQLKQGILFDVIKNDLIKKIKPNYAFIGPAISVLHYEVQADFKNNFSHHQNIRKYWA